MFNISPSDTYRDGELRPDATSRITKPSNIQYSLHEFALAPAYEAYGTRTHEHASWPGISFNPGLWDLSQFNGIYDEQENMFDEHDSAFEHAFSLQCYVAGLSAAYMPLAAFLHIGEENSAYVLNNEERYWDNMTFSSTMSAFVLQ